MVQAVKERTGKKAGATPAKSARKTTTSKRTGKTAAKSANNDDLRQMIAEAAYYRALQRGFNGGDTVGDWLAAEAEINASLGGA